MFTSRLQFHSTILPGITFPQHIACFNCRHAMALVLHFTLTFDNSVKNMTKNHDLSNTLVLQNVAAQNANTGSPLLLWHSANGKMFATDLLLDQFVLSTQIDQQENTMHLKKLTQGDPRGIEGTVEPDGVICSP